LDFNIGVPKADFEELGEDVSEEQKRIQGRIN
jgi:hypothetical protein